MKPAVSPNPLSPGSENPELWACDKRGGGTPSIEGHISRHVKGAGVTYAATETCTPLYSYGKRHSSHMCRELHPLQGTHSTYSLLLTHTGKTPPHKRHTQSGPMLLPRRTCSRRRVPRPCSTGIWLGELHSQSPRRAPVPLAWTLHLGPQADVA